ncbi:MAG: HAMP domain-containing sensor histidine kinase, partial [Alphaproteobacteria bacterium]|nr:HAMP domain-containing sensor histidine kinase [Alphaproteobacteria bacterium]
GGIKVLLAFNSFEKQAIEDKDKQINNQLEYMDVAIKTIMHNFYREVDSIYIRQSFLDEERVWNETGDSTALKDALHSSVVCDNSIYYGTIVYKNGRLVSELSDVSGVEFIKELKNEHICICRNQKNKYYMAYKHQDKYNVSIYRLISLEHLINDLIEVERSKNDIYYLLDKTGTIFIRKEGKIIKIEEVKKIKNADKFVRLNYIKNAQKNNKDFVGFLNLKNIDNKNYNARMLVRPASKTTNGIFTIAETTNYGPDEKENKRMANGIFYYVGTATAGGILTIVFLFLLNFINRNRVLLLTEKNRKMEDINREMQLSAHHQRLETIGTMTAGIAHEFNNLLTPILGYSVMTMEKYSDEEELQENLTEVYNATMKAKDIVSGLADLSRKGNKESFKRIVFDEVLKNVVKETNPVKPDNVSIIEKFGCGNRCILGDSTQISQVAVNIVLNAYDAMKPDGGTLTVSSSYKNKKIIVEFSDTGHGMSTETIANIFDPFYTTKESGKGTGLGMAISAQIVEMHDAKIFIDSELGKGSTFRIEFKESSE